MAFAARLGFDHGSDLRPAQECEGMALPGLRPEFGLWYGRAGVAVWCVVLLFGWCLVDGESGEPVGAEDSEAQAHGDADGQGVVGEVCLVAGGDGGLAGGAEHLAAVVEQDGACGGLHVQDDGDPVDGWRGAVGHVGGVQG